MLQAGIIAARKRRMKGGLAETAAFFSTWPNSDDVTVPARQQAVLPLPENVLPSKGLPFCQWLRFPNH
ncbi:unnamed protein product [Leptidea sinapis]|uniref:Uncharacterized protein n=1 Tax=Leptidea sinapis TaxID=189913 RepID=A0A5E4R799_9NEOP|nr:unnamed protein product [Leptidea sinapis]